MDLVLRHPRELLGDPVYARFGAELPIRFDFLDTMQGGKLSAQVHLLSQYIIPAPAGNYRVRPAQGAGRCATLQGAVRTGS